MEDGVRTFSSDLPTGGQTLGRDVIDFVAERIHERTVKEQQGLHGPLPSLNADYAAHKAEDYGTDKILVKTGQMTSLASLRGRSTVSGNTLEMVYGTGEPPSTGKAADRRATDVAKASFAHQGSHHRPERPFYGLTREDADAVRAFIGQYLDKYCEEASREVASPAMVRGPSFWQRLLAAFHAR